MNKVLSYRVSSFRDHFKAKYGIDFCMRKQSNTDLSVHPGTCRRIIGKCERMLQVVNSEIQKEHIREVLESTKTDKDEIEKELKRRKREKTRFPYKA